MEFGHAVVESGRRCEFGPGQAFIIPRGFSGTCDVQLPTEKLYVIFEPPGANL